LSTELDRAYEVLGIKPGVSDRELKAAHRNLAKVWHPDRFVHDPRLQEKAQVTVSIDPESGLLATPTCPVKSRMTYPSGSEPHGYCNITHVVKPDTKTGLKRFAKRISEIN